MKFWAKFRIGTEMPDCFMVMPSIGERFAAKLKDGQSVLLTYDEERSQPSHRHYFAVIANAWRNLPEDMAADFPSAEHLRKWALIKIGHCRQQVMACRSNAEARRWAQFARLVDEYAVAAVDRRVVTVFMAKSQSLEAMSAAAFQKSKDEVFRVLGELLGVDVTTLSKNGGEDADAQD